MAELSATKHVLIQASPQVVWQVHTDINAWSRWNRSISTARMAGRLAPGASFEWKSGGLAIVSTVQELEPIHRISWTGKALGTTARHSWTLQPQDGGTLVTTEESMSGWLVSILRVLAPAFLDKSLDSWLHDLENRAEATQTRAGS
jgi:uncharacterized protein YndB with AHSA1/START domain